METILGDGLTWRKSSRSSGVGECVEVASSTGTVFVRDSKDPHGPALSIEPASWSQFLGYIREGAAT